ncbi:MAG: ABC transporter ATP-binding protein [SAR202 cluster bacterium]|nr:ABC transporter [Chloroflexota bacterium]MQG51511.1 ABC transporter ATP-binding protein [SAR202 cluster bacterium]|tara:strand:- start:313 stop:1104 length:792 start_codon:yes stop_codon:yes gene_type:complete
MDEKCILKINNVTSFLGNTKVLNNVSLDIKPGTLNGLIGVNGSGKTSLINTINGLIKPTEGSLNIDDLLLDSISDKDIAKLIATVPQNPTNMFGFSCLDVVLMGRNPYISVGGWPSSSDIDIAYKSMKSTGVDQFAKRTLDTLSGGEIQRVFIAKGLAQGTGILLLDEPIANLDISYQIQIMDILLSLIHEQNFTIITSLHDINLASLYCDNLIVIDKGAIVKTGPPIEIIEEDFIQGIFGNRLNVIRNPEDNRSIIIPKSIN